MKLVPRDPCELQVLAQHHRAPLATRFAQGRKGSAPNTVVTGKSSSSVIE
jgi:hypothetical protein